MRGHRCKGRLFLRHPGPSRQPFKVGKEVGTNALTDDGQLPDLEWGDDAARKVRGAANKISGLFPARLLILSPCDAITKN